MDNLRDTSIQTVLYLEAQQLRPEASSDQEEDAVEMPSVRRRTNAPAGLERAQQHEVAQVVEVSSHDGPSHPQIISAEPSMDPMSNQIGQMQNFLEDE